MKTKMKVMIISALAVCALSAGVTTVMASAEETEGIVNPPELALTFEGASVRYNAKDGRNGIRFTVSMAKDAFEYYQANIEKSYTVLSMGETVSKEIDTTKNWYGADEDGRFTTENIVRYQTTVYMYEVPSSYYATEFIAQGFVEMKDETVVSSVGGVGRSFEYVAIQAVKETPALQEALSDYLPTYTVSFEGIDATQSVKYGALAESPDATPSKDGFVFKGWDYDFTQAITGNITVNAIWEETIIKATTLDDIISNADKTGYTIQLQNNIELNHDWGYNTIISALNASLDLNGFKLIYTNVETDAWANGLFIGEITANGSIQNGKIEFIHKGQSNTQHRALFANAVNGLIKDVEVSATTSGHSGSYVGIFGGGSGTFENVVVRLSGTSGYYIAKNVNYFGIVQYGSDTLIFKNCIFVAEGQVELTSYETWANAYIPTFSNALTNVNNTNNVYVRSIGEYMSSNYNTTSFTGNWKISDATGMPYMINDESNIIKVTTVGELQAAATQKGFVAMLQNDLTVDMGSGTTVINQIDAEINLNGYTLTINHTETARWNYSIFTNGVTATGAIVNGTISYNLSAAEIPLEYQNGLLFGGNNGLIKDVNINFNVTGYSIAWCSYYIGLFGASGAGTFENVNATITGTSAIDANGNPSQIGLFAYGSETYVLKNCTFTLSSMPLVASANSAGLEVFTNAANTGNVIQ